MAADGTRWETPGVRLFVALRPSSEAIDHLAGEVAHLRHPADSALRWIDQRRWHVTVAFLGVVDDRRAVRVRDRLESVAARHAAIGPLRLAGAGLFGHRLLWVGVEGAGDPGTDDAMPALHRLAMAVQRGMRRAGAEVETRSWRPHLTLARARADLEPADRQAVTRLREYVGPSWTAAELLLVRSHLGPRPTHETVLAAGLTRGATGRGRAPA
jgi:2'-5' RNA ligase